MGGDIHSAYLFDAPVTIRLLDNRLVHKPVSRAVFERYRPQLEKALADKFAVKEPQKVNLVIDSQD